MSYRSKNEACRICGGVLQGNQRKWLFGGLNKKSSQPQTPVGSMREGCQSSSSQSSPWGSTISLGSSLSRSKSQLSLCSPTKAVDLLSVLTHILGQAVPRGSGQGEFLCGKCVCVLERVFKFDSVIARVRVLSAERLQKMTQERDKIRQWVHYSYRQRHPQDFQSSPSEEDGESDREGYKEMLKDSMALSEYECWSEKWDTCPYFIKTGKRCRKGKSCEGCNSLRVSDSDYESVCGMPRRLPLQPFSPLALSRDKSQSMPLHWSRPPSMGSSPPSLSGSSLSLRASSRTESIQSFDSVDSGGGGDPFDSPGEPSLTSLVLKNLKRIEGKPVSSPSGSRIPVLGRAGHRPPSQEGGTVSPVVIAELHFEEVENGPRAGAEVDGESGDVLTELRDEFLPFHQEGPTGRAHHAVRQLRGQLDQATARIRTLEAQLNHGSSTQSTTTEVNGCQDWASLSQESGDNVTLLQGLSHSLHSRERLIQECMSVIRRLCVEQGAGSELADKLTGALAETLKEILSDNKTALDSLRSEMKEKEHGMEREMEALKKAGRDGESDRNTLNTVLQCNQDIIADLRLALAEKERVQKELEKEGEVWRQRDQALTAAMQEKEVLQDCLKEALESCQRDMQALADSVIGQGLPGGGAEAALSYQLNEKECLLAAWLKDREETSVTMCQEISKLTTALQDYRDVVQKQQESHSQTVSSLTERLRLAQQELRESRQRRKEVDRARQNDRHDRTMEEMKLRDSLEKRDKLIEQILWDAEERDHLFRELQLNLQNKFHHVTAVKHAL